VNTTPNAPAAAPKSTSIWTPLKHKAFRDLWTGGGIYFIGMAMQAMAVAWIMVQNTGSPLLAALVQTAVFMPMFVISMPAGVLADVADRKRVLLIALTVQIAVGALFAVLTFTDKASAGALLLLMFVSGSCMALLSPSWNTTIVDTVPREELGQAITAVGISYNAARALGPAIAGLIFGTFGPSWVFVLAALCSVVMLLTVLRNPPRPHPPTRLPMERLWGGSISGLRYARHSRKILSQLIRTMAYGGAGSALWALLPVIGQKNLGMGAEGFGLLMACLGTGAVLVGTVIGRLRARFGLEALVTAGCVVFASVMLVTSFSQSRVVVFISLGFAGAAWLGVMSSLNTATQGSAAHWVRARATALHTLAALGAFALGSAFWGALSELAGISITLTLAAVAMMAGLLLARAFPLRVSKNQEVTSAQPWEELTVVDEPLPDDGPVAVEISYHVRADAIEQFLEHAARLKVPRRRDGATLWRLYRDLADPTHFTERFLVGSWAEYLHQRSRTTVADHELEGLVRSFLQHDSPVALRHYIAER
jgi:MFS family permease